MFSRIESILSKVERLVALRVEIAEHDLKMRKAYPFPVDLYGPRGTEIRFPERPPHDGISWGIES